MHGFLLISYHAFSTSKPPGEHPLSRRKSAGRCSSKPFRCMGFVGLDAFAFGKAQGDLKLRPSMPRLGCSSPTLDCLLETCCGFIRS
jgi:hypothetical protein